MSFIDTLRSARQSRVAVLHEFLTQYDPHSKRLHVFFEGHDDISFFTPHIERFLPAGLRLLTYRCEGKPRVMETFREIVRKIPDVKMALFFVDKDLDDVLGTPYPTDPRIFVTDVYSIENYIVTTAVLTRLYRDNLRFRDVTFDENVIMNHFEEQLARFQNQVLCIMAWILVTRRTGGRPNLNNLNLAALYRLSDSGMPIPMRGRLKILASQTGISTSTVPMSRLREAKRELKRVPVKRILRGKFEAWFFLRFWQRLTSQLQATAQEVGGQLSIRFQLTESNFVQAVASYVDTPPSLEMFLRAHLPQSSSVEQPPMRMKAGRWQRVVDTIRRLLDL